MSLWRTRTRYIADGLVNWFSHFGKLFTGQKTKTCLPHNPAIPHLVYIEEKLMHMSTKGCAYKSVHLGFTHKSRTWETTKWSVAAE